MAAIIGISGSLRRGSYNTALLRAAAQLMPNGTQLQIKTIRGIPLYDGDLEAADGIPQPVRELKEAVTAADGLLLVTPEYNNSIPGVFKNAIDWLSRLTPQPFADKPVAIMGAAGGALGTGRAQYDLRKTCVFLDMHPLNKPEVFIGAAHTKFDASGKLTDEPTREFIKQLMAALDAWTRRLKP